MNPYLSRDRGDAKAIHSGRVLLVVVLAAWLSVLLSVAARAHPDGYGGDQASLAGSILEPQPGAGLDR